MLSVLLWPLAGIAQVSPLKGCDWSYDWTGGSGTIRIVRTTDLVLQPLKVSASELRLAMGGRSNGERELRMVLATQGGVLPDAQDLEVIWENGRKASLVRSQLEQGPERQAGGGSWECSWATFPLSMEQWQLLLDAPVKEMVLRTTRSVRTVELTAQQVADLRSAMRCVDNAVNLVAQPIRGTAPSGPVVAPSGSGQGSRSDESVAATPRDVQSEQPVVDSFGIPVQSPKVVKSTVTSDEDGTQDVFSSPDGAASPASMGESTQAGSSALPSGDEASMVWATQRLVGVPHSKVRLRAGQQAAMAVLHPFSDPYQLDTFKIVTMAGASPAYFLEIITHDGRLLFKEELLPSGFEGVGSTEPRQLELDRLRAERILGPWSFGSPMPMDLYRQSLDRERNGFLFEVSKEEISALMMDPSAVTFSYYADPEQRRVLTYLGHSQKVVNLVPTYP